MDGKVELNKLSVFMPFVIPQSEEDIHLRKIINSSKELQASFRARKCDFISFPQSVDEFSWRLSPNSANERLKYVIVGFQTNKRGC